MITPVRGDERVDRQQAERRRAIDEDVVVLSRRPKPSSASRSACSRPMALNSSFSVADRSIVDGATSMPAVCVGTMISRADSRVDQHIRHRALRPSARLMPRPTVRFACGIHVDAQDAVSLLGERAGEIDGGRRLADAALLVGDGDDLGHADSLARPADGRGPTGMEAIYERYADSPQELSTVLASCSPFLWISATLPCTRNVSACGSRDSQMAPGAVFARQGQRVTMDARRVR